MPLRRDINQVFPPPPSSLGEHAADYAREIHAPANRPQVYRQIIARGIDDIWSIDLATMHGWRNEYYGKLNENDGNKYMLLIVDTFSAFFGHFRSKARQAMKSRKPLNL